MRFATLPASARRAHVWFPFTAGPALTGVTVGQADLHIHTEFSYDAVPHVADLLAYVSEETTLDVIAITDHDEIDGALRAVEMAPSYRVHVIPGMEVTTRDGHLLVYNVHKLIPPNLSLAATLERVGEQGGYAAVAHPVGSWLGSMAHKTIRAALRDPALAQVLVGVEAWNGSLPWTGLNSRATGFASALDVAHFGNSDAHFLWMVGLVTTRFEGSTIADLERAIAHRTTQVTVGPPAWRQAGAFLHGRTRRVWSRIGERLPGRR
jgi:predicted metal-dependent phosphoesterase TrpH